MILEFFWPKEIKQAIAECKANGSLNEEAVQHLRKLTQKYAVLILLLTMFFFFAAGIWVGLGIILLSPVWLWFECKNTFAREFAPYINGIRREVVVTFSGISLYGDQNIWCKAQESDEKFRIRICNRPKIDPKHFPKKGNKISIFHSNSSKYIAMPDIESLHKKYSLVTIKADR